MRLTAIKYSPKSDTYNSNAEHTNVGFQSIERVILDVVLSLFYQCGNYVVGAGLPNLHSLCTGRRLYFERAPFKRPTYIHVRWTSKFDSLFRYFYLAIFVNVHEFGNLINRVICSVDASEEIMIIWFLLTKRLTADQFIVCRMATARFSFSICTHFCRNNCHVTKSIRPITTPTNVW